MATSTQIPDAVQYELTLGSLTAQLDAYQKVVEVATGKRDAALRDLRTHCRHLHLIELELGPPHRMCTVCGAEERGWAYGYHVLVMQGDMGNPPYKQDRVLVERTTDSHYFYGRRLNRPIFGVGQSHPDFPGAGLRTYEQLTRVTGE